MLRFEGRLVGVEVVLEEGILDLRIDVQVEARALGVVARALELLHRLGREIAAVALDNVASQSLWSRLGFTERERDAINLIVEWRPS